MWPIKFIPQGGWVVHQLMKDASEAFSQHQSTLAPPLSARIYQEQQNPFLQFTCLNQIISTEGERERDGNNIPLERIPPPAASQKLLKSPLMRKPFKFTELNVWKEPIKCKLGNSECWRCRQKRDFLQSVLHAEPLLNSDFASLN